MITKKSRKLCSRSIGVILLLITLCCVGCGQKKDDVQQKDTITEAEQLIEEAETVKQTAEGQSGTETLTKEETVEEKSEIEMSAEEQNVDVELGTEISTKEEIVEEESETETVTEKPEEENSTEKQPAEEQRVEASTVTESETTVEKDEEKKPEFPKVIENGMLKIESVFQYSGINLDCDEEICENIGAIQLTNISEEYLESADITVKLANGAKLIFRIEDIPAGKAVFAFDTANTVFDGQQTVKEITANANWKKNASALVDQLSFTVEGTMVIVKNISGSALKNLTVKYHCDLSGSYFGGKSYAGRIDALGVGESTTISASECYLGEPAVANVFD